MKNHALAIALGLAVMLSSVGCANSILQGAATKQAATVTDIQYQIVLDNLAMLRRNEGALPWHVKLTLGTITATNEAVGTGTYTVAKADSATTTRTITRLASIVPKVTLQQAWQMAPVHDPVELQKLRTRYLSVIREPWIREDGQPSENALVGNYKGKQIWVEFHDLGKLTDATIMILGAAPPTDLEKALAPFLSR